MNTSERRKQILDIISRSSTPISGARLAEDCGVSRQIIVSDISVLKENHDIIATSKGYILQKPKAAVRIVKTVHSDEEIEDELSSIVEIGGRVKDVFVWHKVYGKIAAPLEISSQMDVAEYMNSLRNGRSSPLKKVTSEYHYHTIEADSEKVLDKVEEMLKSKGYLVRED